MISQYNVLNYIYKLENFEEFHYPFDNPASEETKKNEEEKQKTEISEIQKKDILPKFDLLPGFDNIKFIFVNSDLSELIQKAKFQGKFDIVVLGFFHGHHLKDKFCQTLKEKQGYVYAELPVNFVGIKKEFKEKCYEKVENMAKSCGLKKIL